MGTLGLEQQTAPRYHKVTYHIYLANERQMLYTPRFSMQSVENAQTQPVSSANFCHFPIASWSREKLEVFSEDIPHTVLSVEQSGPEV